MLERVGLSEETREREGELGRKRTNSMTREGKSHGKRVGEVMSRLNLGPRAHEATCCYLANLCHYHSEIERLTISMNVKSELLTSLERLVVSFFFNLF